MGGGGCGEGLVGFKGGGGPHFSTSFGERSAGLLLMGLFISLCTELATIFVNSEKFFYERVII